MGRATSSMKSFSGFDFFVHVITITRRRAGDHRSPDRVRSPRCSPYCLYPRRADPVRVSPRTPRSGPAPASGWGVSGRVRLRFEIAFDRWSLARSAQARRPKRRAACTLPQHPTHDHGARTQAARSGLELSRAILYLSVRAGAAPALAAACASPVGRRSPHTGPLKYRPACTMLRPPASAPRSAPRLSALAAGLGFAFALWGGTRTPPRMRL